MVNVPVVAYWMFFTAFSIFSILPILFLVGSRGSNPELESFAILLFTGCLIGQITVIVVAFVNSVI